MGDQLPVVTRMWNRLRGAEDHRHKFGYIDKTGTTVIAPQFDMASQHSEGLAEVKVSGKFGYIDQTGKIFIAPHFDKARIFSDGLAEVEEDGGWGYINATGKYIWGPVK